jgi:hypothetical protein
MIFIFNKKIEKKLFPNCQKFIRKKFSGPAIAVILFNALTILTLFVKVLKMKNRSEIKGKLKSKLRRIFSFTSLIINLGITWILFSLYTQKWNSYSKYFSFIFIALNGSQVSHFF